MGYTKGTPERQAAMKKLTANWRCLRGGRLFRRKVTTLS